MESYRHACTFSYSGVCVLYVQDLVHGTYVMILYIRVYTLFCIEKPDPGQSVSKAMKVLQSLGATVKNHDEIPCITMSNMLKIYPLPVTECGNRSDDIVMHIIGKPCPGDHSASEKVLLLLGATGSGKTTLVMALMNHIFGVNYEDNFRFTIETEIHNLSHAHSQTKLIHIYKLFPSKYSCIPYPLTVIDVPGYGDTRGIKQDMLLTEQFRELFANGEKYGIYHLNGVAIVLPASSVRMTPTQWYILDSIFALFGKDIWSNLILMITFADDQCPPVLEAFKANAIPYNAYFQFNNSAVFSKSTSRVYDDHFGKMYYRMGTRSFDKFLVEFGRIVPVSLLLTKAVLEERTQLDVLTQQLHHNIVICLNRISELSTEEQVLKEQLHIMNENENFTYTVSITKRQKVNIPRNTKALNCGVCHITCHFPCETKDEGTFKCIIMNNKDSNEAECSICPGHCSWKAHMLQDIRYEFVQQQEVRTITEQLQRYESARDKHATTQDAIKNIREDLSKMQKDVMKMIKQARKCRIRLNEIALKPGVLSETDYIDILIQNEKLEQKSGWLQRLQSLKELKKATTLLVQLSDSEENLQSKDFMKNWLAAETEV